MIRAIDVFDALVVIVVDQTDGDGVGPIKKQSLVVQRQQAFLREPIHFYALSTCMFMLHHSFFFAAVIVGDDSNGVSQSFPSFRAVFVVPIIACESSTHPSAVTAGHRTTSSVLPTHVISHLCRWRRSRQRQS
jgi:hypothetical protein